MSDYSNEPAATAAEPSEVVWDYGALPVPVMPDPPQPVLKWWRQNPVTKEIEYKDVPDLQPGERLKEAREAFGAD